MRAKWISSLIDETLCRGLLFCLHSVLVVSIYVLQCTVATMLQFNDHRTSSKGLLRQIGIKDWHLASPILTNPQTRFFALDHA